MNINHLRIFYFVARTLSFSKAAEELHISQPTVSVQVKKLEEELGIDLFEQIGKKIFLTSAGEILNRYAKKIFYFEAEAENELREIRGIKKGKLKIGASTTPGIYILPELIKSFEEQHDGVEINLTIYNSNVIQDLVMANELEYAIIGENIEWPPEELVVEHLVDDELVAIASPEHPLAKKGNIQIKDLVSQRLVLRQKGSSTREILEARTRDLGLELKASMQFNCVEAIKKAIEAKLGVSIVSSRAIKAEIKNGTLKPLNLSGINLKRKLNLIYHKEKRFSPLGREFLTFVTNELKHPKIN